MFGEKGPPVWQHRRLFASGYGEQPTKDRPHGEANADFTVLHQPQSPGRVVRFDFTRIEIHFQLAPTNYDLNWFLSSIFSDRDYFLQPGSENGIVAGILKNERQFRVLGS